MGVCVYLGGVGLVSLLHQRGCEGKARKEALRRGRGQAMIELGVFEIGRMTRMGEDRDIRLGPHTPPPLPSPFPPPSHLAEEEGNLGQERGGARVAAAVAAVLRDEGLAAITGAQGRRVLQQGRVLLPRLAALAIVGGARRPAQVRGSHAHRYQLPERMGEGRGGREGGGQCVGGRAAQVKYDDYGHKDCA